MNRSGSVAVIAALAMTAIVVMSGMAFDLARLYLVQTRLQTAIDAAALIAAREINLANVGSDTAAMFWSNYAIGGQSEGRTYFGAVATDPVLTRVDQNTMTITATATVDLVLGSFVGLPRVMLSDSAQAVRSNTGLELALVLDNTGSMAGWPMQAEISAATELIDILYQNGSVDTVPNQWLSVVPFTAEVNMGANHSNWLASGSLNPNDYLNTTWQGCVLARHADGHDADDAPPSVAPFQPFLWRSTLNQYQNPKGGYLAGDNDWSPTNITEASQSRYGNATVGPDLGCDAVPVLPETASRQAILDTIDRMQATDRGGTFINIGLQAGWFTLSPSWAGLWGTPSLPLPYDTKNMLKVIVLMTDGNNEWYSDGGFAPGSQGDTDYTAYERVSNRVLGPNVTASNATAMLNASMLSMCTTIKNAGILLYTILFNHDGSISSSTQQLFQSCATSPQDYFLTPSNAQLQAAFSAIASQLASLRLSQ